MATKIPVAPTTIRPAHSSPMIAPPEAIRQAAADDLPGDVRVASGARASRPRSRRDALGDGLARTTSGRCPRRCSRCPRRRPAGSGSGASGWFGATRRDANDCPAAAAPGTRRWRPVPRFRGGPCRSGPRRACLARAPPAANPPPGAPWPRHLRPPLPRPALHLRGSPSGRRARFGGRRHQHRRTHRHQPDERDRRQRHDAENRRGRPPADLRDHACGHRQRQRHADPGARVARSQAPAPRCRRSAEPWPCSSRRTRAAPRSRGRRHTRPSGKPRRWRPTPPASRPRAGPRPRSSRRRSAIASKARPRIGEQSTETSRNIVQGIWLSSREAWKVLSNWGASSG